MLLLFLLGTRLWMGRVHEPENVSPMADASAPEPASITNIPPEQPVFSPLRPRTNTSFPTPIAASMRSEVKQDSNIIFANAPEQPTTASATQFVAQPGLVATANPALITNSCRSNLEAIVWAANVWCWTHRDRQLPANLMLLTNELPSPSVLVCPSDLAWSSKALATWSEFSPEWISYRVSSDVKSRLPNARVGVSVHYLQCPFHSKAFIWQLGDRPAPPGGWNQWWLQNP